MNLVGQILISLPNIKDERFFKSVIYICAHSSEGAMGFIINKSLELDYYPELLKQLGLDNLQSNKKIYFNYGGPVEPNRGFVLHSDDFIKKESLPIDKGIALTSTVDVFKDLSKGLGPKFTMLTIGYAGWGPGQLENEISNNGWLSSPIDKNFIFEEKSKNKWEKAYEILGIKPHTLHKNFGKA
tara:strand:- start:525 stop:1076 length:552 start_codon:yes stop_codon:yes gene_type:complete